MDQPRPKASDVSSAAPRPGSIVLARHGRPTGDRKIKIDHHGFVDWWAEYDRAGLADGETPPDELKEEAARADVIFASPLQRAVATAGAVAQGKPVIQDDVFVEARLPPPAIWGKRSARAWGVWSRVSWWLGRSGGQESRTDAELRARAAAATLTARALRGENVILFGHGWFNRMIRPVLLSQGWRCVRDGGDTYWSFRRYEYRGRR